MKDIRETIGLFLILLLTSCNADSSVEYVTQEMLKPEYTIKINLDEADFNNPLKLDSSTQWMDVSIGLISRIEIIENYLFVFNSSPMGRDFNVYDTKLNRSIFSISEKRIYDFSIDRIHKQITLLSKGENIRVFTFEGELIREYRLSKEVVEIRNLSNNKLVGYDNYIDNGNANYYIFDTESGDILTKYLSFSKEAQGIEISVNTSLSRNNNDIIYATTFFSNFIYELDENSINKWLELDFGKSNPNFEELLVQRKKTSPFELAMQNNWVYTIDKIIESDDYLVCVVIKNGRALQILLDKNDPLNWSILPDLDLVTTIGNTFVNIIKDKNSVVLKNGKILTKKVKLEFYNKQSTG
jgi:hypothetical protein